MGLIPFLLKTAVQLNSKSLFSARDAPRGDLLKVRGFRSIGAAAVVELLCASHIQPALNRDTSLPVEQDPTTAAALSSKWRGIVLRLHSEVNSSGSGSLASHALGAAISWDVNSLRAINTILSMVRYITLLRDYIFPSRHVFCFCLVTSM